MLAILALLWDYFKWRYSETVQLSVSASAGFRSTTEGNQTFIHVSVTNVGKIATTIKLISRHGFNTKSEMRKKRNGSEVGIITPYHGQLPCKLNPTDDWVGMIKQDFQGVEKYLKYPFFCIQIEDTMSKKPFRVVLDKSRFNT